MVWAPRSAAAKGEFQPARDQPVAVCLAALAGYVDAIGFLWLGGFFLSFMTGNSTRLGIALPSAGPSQAAIPAAMIALFVGGVVVSSVLRRLVHRRAPRWGRASVMSLVTVLLLGSCAGQATSHTAWAIAAAVLAMGAVNTVFEHDGEVSIGLTYMTGTLVKMGQHIAQTLLGGSAFGWLPHMLRWLGMLCGVLAGTIVYQHIGLRALWAAAAHAGMMTLVTAVLRPRSDPTSAAPSGSARPGGHG